MFSADNPPTSPLMAGHSAGHQPFADVDLFELREGFPSDRRPATRRLQHSWSYTLMRICQYAYKCSIHKIDNDGQSPEQAPGPPGLRGAMIAQRQTKPPRDRQPVLAAGRHSYRKGKA